MVVLPWEEALPSLVALVVLPALEEALLGQEAALLGQEEALPPPVEALRREEALPPVAAL